MDNSKEVLRLSTNELFPETEIPDLSFGIETYGVFRPCTQASSRGFEDCQLIHTGRFLQQRFINNLPGLFGYELLQSGLDIVAWPDRLSLLLRMSLAANSPRDGRDAFVVRFSVPAAYQAVPAEGGLKVFRHPVTGNGGNWRMTHREATGNRITVAAQRGTVEKHYPIVIAAENDEAHFTVAGGMGYVPLTVTGLSSYYRPAFYVKKNGKWKKIDQSNHGNDFWQIDYYQHTGKWECTYNIDLDSEQDQPVTQEFMFTLDKDDVSSIAAPNTSHEELRIYPNPVKDKFYLQLPAEWGYSCIVEIFDNAGKIVSSRHISNTTEAVDVSELVHGIYIIRMSNPNFSQSCKIYKI